MFFNKKIFTIHQAALLLAVLLSLYACSTNHSREENITPEQGTNSDIDSTSPIAKVKNVFYSVPSPLQVASLLKHAGAKYNPAVLNLSDNVTNYSTNFSKAVNIGIYGLDLAYANMFGQTQEAIKYLAAIKKLAEGVGLSPIFEAESIYSRFQSNFNNQDSLFIIISDLYRESDDYLKDNQQFNTAALIVAGGWIEGLYIATRQVDPAKPESEIAVRIGEQKFSLKNLLLLLTDFKNDPEFDGLIKELQELQQVYDNVNVSYNEKPVTTDVKNKVTIINTQSRVTMTSGQIMEITEKIKGLRARIVKS